jgi:YVTN family beta-propeller protein
VIDATTADDERGVAFGVLGPLRVTRGDAAVPLGGRQQRAVLARLLLADGGGLSVEQLADALWGEHVPPGASTTIQTYVFRLRQALEPDRERGAPGQVVITDDGRYRLAVPPDRLDAAVFEQHLAAGQRHLAAGSPVDAVTELDQALALWRGEVLADLADYEFVQPEATRLSDKRMAALEAKLTAELALGRHADVVGELDKLVARYPLNEQLQRQRIIALYRCGRPSDALAAYDQLRRQLADELGADPSPPLQQLHQQLLTHDPALAWHPTDDRPPVATLPVPPSEEAAPDTVPFGPQRIAAKARRRGRPWLRTRWLILAVVLVVVAAGAGIAAVVLTHGPKHTLAAIPPNSVAVIDRNGAMHDAIPVGANPVGLAYGAGSVWVANSGDNTVMRINPKTHEVVQTFPVGADPVAIAVDGQRAWVANALGGTVTEIDATTNSVVADAIPVGNLPKAIAAQRGSVWVANAGDDTVQRIDSTSARADSPVDVGGGPDGLAIDGSSLWVSNGHDATVWHLDTSTGQPVNLPSQVGAGPSGLAMTRGVVWVANNGEQTVSRIDEPTGHVSPVGVGDGPSAVVADGSRLWVSDDYDGTVSVIDASSARLLSRFRPGSVVRGMTMVGSSLWVATQGFPGAAHAGGTFVVEGSEAATDTDRHYVDPARSDDDPLQIRSVYDGLLAYRAANEADGLTLVPDLATQLPSQSDGGRTYTFFLRRGIRYSDGRTVVASDIRRGVQRALIVGETHGRPDYYFEIDGGQRCHDAPTTCDLHAGVDADDRTGRITFHLLQPDPSFLYKLTEPFLVVATPPGVPLTKPVTSPMPSTGPYMITSYARGKDLVLSRNPMFRPWSYAAQPPGYPDEIRWHFESSTQVQINDVLAGKADLVDLDDADETLTETVRRNHPELFHLQSSFALAYAWLNTREPPFNNVDVRQAVSYAVDRRKLVDLHGGKLQATPTCQILMPSFPTYQPYCPYTDQTYAPNLARARELVDHSGTKGMTVGVWAPQAGTRPAEAGYFVSVLRSLGYRAQLHIKPAGFPTIKFLIDPRNHIQMGIAPGWSAASPAPSEFLQQLFTCDAIRPDDTNLPNISNFCDKTVDALVAAAETAELANNDVAARSLWRQAERKIVTAAPIVPIAVDLVPYLTSARARNVEATPTDFPALDQAWVK